MALGRNRGEERKVGRKGLPAAGSSPGRGKRRKEGEQKAEDEKGDTEPKKGREKRRERMMASRSESKPAGKASAKGMKKAQAASKKKESRRPRERSTAGKKGGGSASPLPAQEGGAAAKSVLSSPSSSRKPARRATAKPSARRPVGKPRAPAVAPAPAPWARSGEGRPEFVPWTDSLLLLQSVDPYWALASWEVDPRALALAKERAGDSSASVAVRFYEVSSVEFDGENANEIFDVAVSGPSGNYYVNLWGAGKTLVAELGAKARDGCFCPVVRSNTVDLPRDGESSRYEDRRARVLPATDSLWKARSPPPPESEAPFVVSAPVAEAALASSSDDEPDFQFITEWAGRPGSREGVLEEYAADNDSLREATGEAARAPPPEEEEAQPVEAPTLHQGHWGEPAVMELEERLRESLRGSVGLSSAELLGPGGGVSSEEKPARDERPHLEVKADIVIYGRAQPGTEVVIDGMSVQVRTDGTFDLRFALPPEENWAVRNRLPALSELKEEAGDLKP